MSCDLLCLIFCQFIGMKCRYHSVQGTSFFIFVIHGNFILSDAKSVNIRDKKITIFRGKEKKTYLYIHQQQTLTAMVMCHLTHVNLHSILRLMQKIMTS
jgi:hypothetical protein